MAPVPEVVGKAAPEKVKVKVEAEFWIDPLDHVPLAERTVSLLKGGQMESDGSLPMRGVDVAVKQVTPRVLLEVFMSELARALKPLSMHGCEKQKVAESCPQLDNGESSRGQIHHGIFADRRSAAIQSDAAGAKFKPVRMPSCMDGNAEDRHAFEDCRSSGSQLNVCQCANIVPCMGLEDCAGGHDNTIKVKLETPEKSVHRDACVAHERIINVNSEADREHIDFVSLQERCRLSHHSTSAGEFSQVGVYLEPGHCHSLLAEASNITATQGGKIPMCYSKAACQQAISSHTQNEYDGSSGADILHKGQGRADINVDRACNGESMESVLRLRKQSSFNVNKRSSSSTFTAEESSAKRMCTSISFCPKSHSLNRIEVLSDACKDNISSGTSNLLEKEIKSPTICQKERHSKADCPVHDSSLSTSIVLLKVELADEDADAQLYGTDALKRSSSLHPSPSTQGKLQAFICQEDIPSVLNNLQDHERGGLCTQETFINNLESAPVPERGGSYGVKNQPCLSTLSFLDTRVKVEDSEDDSNNQVPEANAAYKLCSSILSSEKGPALKDNVEVPESSSLEPNNCGVTREAGSSQVNISEIERLAMEKRETWLGKNYWLLDSSLKTFLIRLTSKMPDGNYSNHAPEANGVNHVYTSAFDSREDSVPVNPHTVSNILSNYGNYRENVSFLANDLQQNQERSMFPHWTPEDALVAVNRKSCSDIDNQTPHGALSFSPRRMKAETPEEIDVVCASETSTATKFSTLSFDSSDKSEGYPCEATSHTICDKQAVQVGHTYKMPADVSAGSNSAHLLSDSALSTFPVTVKVETSEESYISSVYDTETTANFSCSASVFSDKVVGMNSHTAVGKEPQIGCNMTSLISDSCLSTIPLRVKDEPMEEVHVDAASETKTKTDSSIPIFDSPKNLPTDIQCPSEAINCQNSTPSKFCSVQHNQESSIPQAMRIVTGEKQTCTNHEHLDSDASTSTVIENVERSGERCANFISENTATTFDSSYSSNTVVVKSEPVEGGIQNLCNNPLGVLSNSDMVVAKDKSEFIDELSIDALDHLPLTERVKMLASNMGSELKPAKKSRCFKQTRVCAVGCDSVKLLKVKAKSSSRQRKRKKTATDSVEVALEEDAPGLLQGLLDRGINLDEIKLYGCEEDVDALDISSDEDGFGDLEAVISKLFSERPTSLFKLAPLRSAKGTKAAYCLACLISLIEQTRYLRFRNHPVEWGWCRDLQSFIFVFKMHNRIVLERPEYGYATYFFELVASFPIHWQIKRLVTAMKLTSCSRATLIENRPLLVGVDLSEGEARVLEEYGWQPNTGLGSMLNYSDRVVHDSGNERDISEWRQKIGKLLMNGYDGGCIVKSDLPKKVVDYVGCHCPEIKLET